MSNRIIEEDNRREYIERALHLNFGKFAVGSKRYCSLCHKHIAPYAYWCHCNVNVYCSPSCYRDDQCSYSPRCTKVKALSADIETKTSDLRRYHPHDVIMLFDGTVPDASLTRHMNEDYRQSIIRQFQNERSELLDKRNELVKELMHEGSRKGNYAADYTSGVENVRAYDMACEQSLKLLLLQKSHSAAELVLHVLLLTGRFEGLNTICCHYMRREIDVTSRKGLDMIGQEQINPKNITESFAESRAYTLKTRETRLVWEDYELFGGNNLAAMVHMFLLKYILHMSMENLHHINTNFLNANKDCMILIGEYVGMKKEWIVAGDNNTYKDQAYKVARMIHCSNMYGYEGYENRVNECFDKIREGAQEYFYNGRTSVINEALTTGKTVVNSFRLQPKLCKSASPTVWTVPCSELKKCCEAELAIVYKFEVRSLLMNAVGRINILAGWNAVGSGNYRPPPDRSRPHLCITEFVTDALKTCPEYSFKDVFDNPHLSDIFYGTSRHDSMTEDMEELFDEKAVGFLDEALLICISLEQKLAYCNFHQNRENDDVLNILAQIPGENSVYISDSPPDCSDFAVRKLMNSSVDIDLITMANSKLVTALFKQGLATKDNLDILFGRSGYVSYQIWKLQKQKEERRQPSIWSFITNSRLWKEGCTDIDRRSGLKIKYLNRQDRSQKFVGLMQGLTKLVPIGSILESVVPSVERFVSKFGWNCLNDTATKQLLMEWISSYEVGTDKSLNIEDNANPKRRRCDIDSFLTAEDACRHYFDTRSLEEAVWDAAGVPRIIILNGNRDRMQKAGWRSIKGGIRGDEGLRLGSRIAHVYSPSCLVYEEQVKPTYEDRPQVFSGFDEFKYRRDFTC